MGLARMLFGFDKRDIDTLRKRVRVLEEENKKLWRQYYSLEADYRKLVAEYEGMREALGRLVAGLNELSEWRNRVEERIGLLEEWQYEILEEIRDLYSNGVHGSIESEDHEDSGVDARSLVLEKIAEGITSPTEIIEATGLSKRKVYEVLRELVEEGILEKRREGRRVHYILRSDSLTMAQRGEAQAGA